MGTKIKEIIIRSEKELNGWFINNYKELGYSKIIRKDIGVFPDFIMMKKGKEVRVELETLSSHFILHNHNKNDVDEVVCIKEDLPLEVETVELNQLEFSPRITRVSATINPETKEMLNEIMKEGIYRNTSHAIEDAIKILYKVKNENKK